MLNDKQIIQENRYLYVITDFFFFSQKFSFSNFFKRPITLKTLANQNQRASLTAITIIYLIVLEIYPNHVYLS